MAKELTLDINEVELILVDLILEGRLIAQIDQVNSILEIGEAPETLESKKLKALSNWADSLSNYSESFANKLI